MLSLGKPALHLQRLCLKVATDGLCTCMMVLLLLHVGRVEEKSRRAARQTDGSWRACCSKTWSVLMSCCSCCGLDRRWEYKVAWIVSSVQDPQTKTIFMWLQKGKGFIHQRRDFEMREFSVFSIMSVIWSCANATFPVIHWFGSSFSPHTKKCFARRNYVCSSHVVLRSQWEKPVNHLNTIKPNLCSRADAAGMSRCTTYSRTLTSP